ncbi:TPA: Rho-binding antiterminator [Pseudomonas aeruginosa]
MDSYRPIACDLHDYLEIACLYRYRLLLELEDGVRFEAEARTTHTRAVRPGGGKEEYLEVAVEGATLLLRLDRLLAISALTEAALLGRIRLREEACSRASGMPSSHLGN